MFNTHITEKVPRSVAKMFTWRALMVVQYFCIGYYTTGSIAFGAGLAGFTTIVNSTLYFFHERAWNATDWDRKVKEE